MKTTAPPSAESIRLRVAELQTGDSWRPSVLFEVPATVPCDPPAHTTIPRPPPPPHLSEFETAFAKLVQP